MSKIAITGPSGCHAWQAARQFSPEDRIVSYPHMQAAADAFAGLEADFLVMPVYNTRIGGIMKSFQILEKLPGTYWLDNIVLPIHLSLGALDSQTEIKIIIGTRNVLSQCQDYLSRKNPDLTFLSVPDLDTTIKTIQEKKQSDHGVIEAESVLLSHGLTIREREVVPHNQTRFAVIGRKIASRTGYDATYLLTSPLRDRVGLLYETMGEFSNRGINILDMRAETDSRSQMLQIFLEVEGHIEDQVVKDTITTIEEKVIQEPGTIRVLGSYPRIDMRVKRIKKFGFIGTGEMSTWFAERLEYEGYQTVLTGRNSKIRPEEMIPVSDVVLICVPISKTAETIEQFGPLLKDGQALILLAGEAENNLNTALETCSPGVEVMLVHNLWGPAAANMKDKNVSVVRTSRSGRFCGEFEAFLYKHGAIICHDTTRQHDLLMGVGQKLPTTISVALALALEENNITPTDIPSHATLTSLYSILAMSRIHSQNPRTYAEIMAAGGAGRNVVRSFTRKLQELMDYAEEGKIEEICQIMEKNREYLSDEFLDTTMKQALAVDNTLKRIS
ncbi:MAG: prephenate dehydratase domain-containing protein [Desulfurivibrionaceae bacterium]